MPIIRKKSSSAKRVQSVRQVSNFEELNDVNIESVGNAQDGHVLVYDSSIDKFVLVDPDVVLSTSVQDSDLPDDFISQLEGELDLGEIQIDVLDGGGF
tara:strand:+ start:6583 stop:6876 length:294 start_codon:yes stop_codon:yes gene_type:complete